MEKIEGEFSLWQKKVPKVRGKCRVNAGQYVQEMALESANSTFSLGLAMHIWWDKLEFCIPLEGDGFFECHTGLVVKNLEVNQKTPGCQACHNGIVGYNALAVTFGLECLLEDEIAVSVEDDHDVLVPQACPD